MPKVSNKLKKQMRNEAEQGVDKKIVARIAELVDEVRGIDGDIDMFQEQLKEATDLRRSLLEKIIPEAMAEAGLSSLQTESGVKVSLVGRVFAAIPKGRIAEAVKWLDLYSYGDIVKRTVTTLFNPENAKGMGDFTKDLEQQGLDYSSNFSVHASTLKAWALALTKERSASNKKDMKRLNPPKELFGMYERTEAKITKAE